MLPGLSLMATQNRIKNTNTPSSHLPVLRDSIPHPNLPCMACSHQLVANKEEIVHRHTETEHAWGGGERSELMVESEIGRDDRADKTHRHSLPISLPLPPSWMLQRMMLLSEAAATILSLSPCGPPTTLALSAMRSMVQSR